MEENIGKDVKQENRLQIFQKIPVKTLRFVGLGVLLVLIAAGVYVYAFVYNSPENRVKRMFASYSKKTSAEYAGNFGIEASNLSGVPTVPFGSSKLSAAVTFTGASDTTDPKHPLSRGTLNFGFVMNPENTLKFSIDTVSKDNSLYIEAKNLPQMPYFDISFFNNKWIKVDLQEIIKKYKLDKNNKQKTSKLSDKDTNALKDAFKKSRVFKDTKYLGSTSVNGVAVDKFLLQPDKTEAKKLIKTIYKIVYKRDVTNKELEGFDKLLSNSEDKDAKITSRSEVWIGMDDNLPYNFSLLYTVMNKKRPGTAKMTLNMQFKNYDKKVTVTVPSKSQSIDEIMNDFGTHIQESMQQNYNTPYTPYTPSGTVPYNSLPQGYVY